MKWTFYLLRNSSNLEFSQFQPPGSNVKSWTARVILVIKAEIESKNYTQQNYVNILNSTQLINCSQATKFMTELHAIFHKIESTHCQKVIINATFTSLMSSMPSHSLCYAKLVQHRFVTSLILNFSEKMFCFCNVNLNNFESSKYQNKFWRNIRVENN